MFRFSKRHVTAFIPAACFCVALMAQPVFAQQAETVIVQEKSVTSETVSNPNTPNAAQGVAPGQAPFSDNRERLPARTAIIGQEKTAGGAMPVVVNYASDVVKQTPTELVLTTMLSQKENDAILSQLAGKVYAENNGPQYDLVTIFWLVGENPQPASAWARTDIRKGDTVFAIIKLVP